MAVTLSPCTWTASFVPCKASSSTTTMSMPPSAIPCLQVKPTNASSKCFSKGLAFVTSKIAMGAPARMMVTVKASSDIKATGPDGGVSLSESEDEPELPFDELFLEPRLYKELEHRMKLRVPKYVKLRRKKLMHRRIRKRGPGRRHSKANKLKDA